MTRAVQTVSDGLSGDYEVNVEEEDLGEGAGQSQYIRSAPDVVTGTLDAQFEIVEGSYSGRAPAGWLVTIDDADFSGGVIILYADLTDPPGVYTSYGERISGGTASIENPAGSYLIPGPLPVSVVCISYTSGSLEVMIEALDVWPLLEPNVQIQTAEVTSVSTSGIMIIDSNYDRVGVVIQNTGNEDCAIGNDDMDDPAKGILLKAGETLTFSKPVCPLGPIYAIRVSADTTVRVTELRT